MSFRQEQLRFIFFFTYLSVKERKITSHSGAGAAALAAMMTVRKFLMDRNHPLPLITPPTDDLDFDSQKILFFRISFADST